MFNVICNFAKQIIYNLLIMRNLVLLFSLFLTFSVAYAQKYTLSGHIRDSKNGEDLIGAGVFIPSLKVGAVANEYGFYSLTLPSGKYTLTVKYVGFQSIDKEIELKSNQVLDFMMESETNTLQEIEVKDQAANKNVQKVDMSVEQLQIKTIKQIPALMGEVDIIKAIQLLPGVKSTGEGSSGFSVRGGGSDQNLILLDEATVFNSSHLFGFFSVFNPDVVKDVKLYKGGIPAEYGGRLSSVLDIRMRDGNNKKFACEAGIGIISSRLLFEGPIVKNKASFVIAARRTYADMFLPIFAKDESAKKTKAYFYDLSAKVNYEFNDKNRIFLSGYFGNDIFKFGSFFNMNYGNKTLTARYNSVINSRIFCNTSLIFSNFNYGLGTPEGSFSFYWKSNIIDYSLKNDWTFFFNPNNTIKYGISATYHKFKPGKLERSENSSFTEFSLPDSYALEYGAFLSNEQKINDVLSIDYGIRYSMFQNVGKGVVYYYNRENNKEYLPTDSMHYASGRLYKTFSGLEPRLGFRIKLNESTSIKGSYNRTTQYIHLASNTMSPTPLDLWFPSSPNVKPEIADQVALGFFKNLNKNAYETSVEIYYKDMQNVVDFRDHAELLINKHLEGELRIGDGYSYGAEFYIKKQEGAFTGWISYTYSRTMRKIPEINNGKEFPSSFDKPHDIAIVASYQLNKRVNLSANWVYSTGAPRTMPLERFVHKGMVTPIYSERNGYRIPDYHRLDLSLTLDNKPRKHYTSNWNFSIYNVYNRHNAFAIMFTQDVNNPNVVKAEKVYLFKIIPSVSYNIKF